MRHRKTVKRFSRSRAQKKALLKSLLRALLVDESIVTTTPKAKFLKSEFDKLITWAKKNDLSRKRLAYKVLESHTLVKKLFDNVGPRFNSIAGGYTRILRVGTRKGDGAPLSILELTRKYEGKKVQKGKKAKIDDKVVVNKTADKPVASKVKSQKKRIASGVKKIFGKGKIKNK